MGKFKTKRAFGPFAAGVCVRPKSGSTPVPTTPPAVSGVAATFNTSTRLATVNWDAPRTGTVELTRLDSTGATGTTTKDASLGTYTFSGAIAAGATSVTLTVKGQDGSSLSAVVSTNPSVPVDDATRRQALVLGTYKPDSSTTGVYSDTPLTVTSSHSPQSNQTYRNLDIMGSVSLAGLTGVKYINCRFNGAETPPSSASSLVRLFGPHGGGHVFEDCTFAPKYPHFNWNGIQGYGFTVRRCNFYEGTDGIQIFNNNNGPSGASDRTLKDGPVNVVVEQCYFHDNGWWPQSIDTGGGAIGSHSDQIQYQGGSNVSIRGNNFTGMIATQYGPNSYGTMHCNATILVKPDVGIIKNVVMDKNWIDGGSYSVNINDKAPDRYIDNIGSISSNKFGRNQRQQGTGGDNTFTLHMPDSARGVFTGNIYEDTSTPIRIRGAHWSEKVKSIKVTPDAGGAYQVRVVITATTSHAIKELAVAVRAATNPVDNSSLDPTHVSDALLAVGDTTFDFTGNLPDGNYVAHVAMLRVTSGEWIHDSTTVPFTVDRNAPPSPESQRVALLGISTGRFSGLPFNSGVNPAGRGGRLGSPDGYEFLQDVIETSGERGVAFDIRTAFQYQNKDFSNSSQAGTYWNDLKGMQVLDWFDATKPCILGMKPFPKGGSYTAAMNGDYDAEYIAIGQTIASKRPAGSTAKVGLRLAWEMNGNWYDHGAYVVDSNFVPVADYVAGTQRIISKIREGAGNRVFFIQCWSASTNTRYQSTYWGDAYADAIGIDVYDAFAGTTNGIHSRGDLLATGLGGMFSFARSHNKLVSIDEWGGHNTTVGAGASSNGHDNVDFPVVFYDWIMENLDAILFEAQFNDNDTGNVENNLWNTANVPVRLPNQRAALVSKVKSLRVV